MFILIGISFIASAGFYYCHQKQKEQKEFTKDLVYSPKSIPDEQISFEPKSEAQNYDKDGFE
jgi:hypothetical protein